MNNYNFKNSILHPGIFIPILACSFMIIGCIEDKTGEQNVVPPLSEIGSFDFSTTKKINLSVNYELTFPILFEVYSKNPYKVIGEDIQIKDDKLEPVFRAITDNNGKFNDIMSIPTAFQELFLYTEYMGAPTLVPIPVIGNTAQFDINIKPAATSASLITRAVNVTGDAMTIGEWNTLGTPLYLLTRVKLDGELINNIKYSLPESVFGVGMTGDKHGLIREGESIGDIHILKETKINLIFMQEGANMLNTLTYYTYPTNNPPKTKEEIKRIIAFPNCSFAYSGGELSSGDRVQLKYWNGTSFVEEFPAGTTIGWCFIANGFKNSTVNANYTPLTFYSTPNFNPENKIKQHCVALRDQNKKIIALGFEDQNRETERNGAKLSDSDFNDVVFYIESEVENGFDDNGIPDIIPNPTPKPDPEDNYLVYNGSLAFEDLWPSKGDYDMNDVVIDYHSTLYRNSDNKVIKIIDKFTPRWSGAGKTNGFGYQLNVANSQISKVKIESECIHEFNLFKTDGKGMELNQNKATIMLFEDIKNILHQGLTKSTTFTVNIDFISPVASDIVIPPYNPFIVSSVGSNSRDTEVHLPNQVPTNLANKSLLNTGNDASDSSKDIYYISKENYMFALNVPISFNFPSEKQTIEAAYPRFTDWIKSKGQTNADWYMDTKK